jgi:hypothetical protein
MYICISPRSSNFPGVLCFRARCINTWESLGFSGVGFAAVPQTALFLWVARCVIEGIYIYLSVVYPHLFCLYFLASVCYSSSRAMVWAVRCVIKKVEA